MSIIYATSRDAATRAPVHQYWTGDYRLLHDPVPIAARRPDGAVLDDLPALPLPASAARMLAAARAAGLPWSLALYEDGPGVGLWVLGARGAGDLLRWGWYQGRVSFRPHLTLAQGQRALEEARTRPRVEYRCPACGVWSEWTRGRSRRAGAAVDEYWCPSCGTATPVVRCQTRTGVTGRSAVTSRGQA